jgi:hypothetical protein
MLNRVWFVAAASVALTSPVLALTPVVSPDAAYRTGTTLLGVPASPIAITSVADPELHVTFSTALLPLTVGAGWATWGSPPDTEQSNPRVLWTQGSTSLTFTFSDVLTGFGFEAQPNPFGVYDITAEFFSGAVSLGTITRSVDGNGGARLFAAAADFGDTISSVVVTSSADFAVAQLRYTIPSGIIPEPATWAMMIAGFGLVGVAARRRRLVGA